ncbi:MAG: methyltransferase domain-containing protein [Fibrobacterales bacterium]
MNKIEIGKRFSHAARTYGSVAAIQRSMAENLYDVVTPHIPSKSSVLEFGVGTGGLSSLFCSNEQIHDLTMVDLSSSMLKECEKVTQFAPFDTLYINEDIEQLSLKKKYDLVISNATVQWLSDFEALIEKFSKALKPGAFFAFTFFGPQSLHELYSSYAETQVSPLSNPVHFYTQDFVESSMVSNNFKIIKSGNETLQSVYPTVREVLKSLKKMGTTPRLHSDSQLTKSSLQKLEEHYHQHFSSKDGVKCSWETIWIVGKKV